MNVKYTVKFLRDETSSEFLHHHTSSVVSHKDTKKQWKTVKELKVSASCSLIFGQQEEQLCGFFNIVVPGVSGWEASVRPADGTLINTKPPSKSHPARASSRKHTWWSAETPPDIQQQTF